MIDKKRRTDPKDFVVVIKPTVDATYKNTVNILDEMTIDVIKRYAMVDISPQEYELIKADGSRQRREVGRIICGIFIKLSL